MGGGFWPPSERSGAGARGTNPQAGRLGRAILDAIRAVAGDGARVVGSNMYISAAGAAARMRDLDVVANNLANLSTAGFKRQQSVFEAVMQSAIQDGSGRLQAGAPGRSFVATSALATDFQPGSVQATGGALDVAIRGQGFFEIQTPEGPRYTRAGAFVIDPEGVLTLPGAGAVVGPGGAIEIGSGEAHAQQSGRIVDANGEEIGRLKVVSFENPQSLRRQANNLFEAGVGQSPEEVQGPSLVVGAIEGSNVVPVRELSSLVMLQRAFESNLRALQSDDEATNTLIQEFSR